MAVTMAEYLLGQWLKAHSVYKIDVEKVLEILERKERNKNA